MLYLLDRLNKRLKKKKSLKELDKVYKNSNIPFLLSIFGRDEYIQMEVLRQYQLGSDMIKSPNGFAVFVIVGFNKEHQENIKKIDVFNDLIRIDTDVEKYLYLCENNVEKLQQVLALFKKEIFEVEEGENYSFSIKSFLPRSRANER